MDDRVRGASGRPPWPDATKQQPPSVLAPSGSCQREASPIDSDHHRSPAWIPWFPSEVFSLASWESAHSKPFKPSSTHVCTLTRLDGQGLGGRVYVAPNGYWTLERFLPATSDTLLYVSSEVTASNPYGGFVSVPMTRVDEAMCFFVKISGTFGYQNMVRIHEENGRWVLQAWTGPAESTGSVFASAMCMSRHQY
jgi:hypothetical protein